MARSQLHRLTAVLLLSTYSVASIAGGLLHHHDHETEHQHGAHCQHSHASAHDHHSHADHDEHEVDHGFAEHGDCDHDADAIAVTSDTGHSLFDDDCSACRFVGQRTLATQAYSADTISTHSVELAVRYTSQSGISIARTLHSRAPPCLG